jgi:hypothetical protein
MTLMKPILCSSLFCLFFLQTVRSQDSSASHSTYNAIIKYHFKGLLKTTSFQGYFVTIEDSSLFVSASKMPINFMNPELGSLQRIDYRNLESAKIYQRQKNVLTIVLCTLVGAGIGALIGHGSGNDSNNFNAQTLVPLDAGQKALIGALIGGGAGSLIGVVITKAQEKKFLINGEWKNLEEMKATLVNAH